MTRFKHGLVALMLFLMTFAVHGSLLGYFFTQPNTFPTIHSARIQGTADLQRVLTHPMKSLRERPDRVYRPVSSLSFSLDYALWGLEPAGYHLTDLLVYAFLGIGVYALVARLDGGNPWSGILAAGLVQLHPYSREVLVPISHRQNALAAMFLVWALFSYFRYRDTVRWSYRWWTWLFVGVLLSLLAMGAKEIGVLVVPLVVTGELLREKPPRSLSAFRRNLPERLGALSPFAVTAAAYVSYWSWVTGGSALVGGGEDGPLSMDVLFEHGLASKLSRFLGSELWRYARVYRRALVDVLHPALPGKTNLFSFFGTDPPAWTLYVSVVLLVGVLGVLFEFRRRGMTKPSAGENPSRRRRAVRFVGRLLAGLGLVAIAGFPWIMTLVGDLVAGAYRGTGFFPVEALMEGRTQVPLERYLIAAKRGLMSVSAGILAAGLVLLAAAAPRRVLRFLTGTWRRLTDRPAGRHVLFFTAWVLWCYLFHAFTTTPVVGPGRKRFLLPMIGLLGALAVPASRLPGAVASAWRGRGSSFGRAGAAAVALLLLVGMIPRSPLFVDYSGLDQAQRMNGLFYRQMEFQLEGLPPRSVISVQGVPVWTGWKHVLRTHPYVGTFGSKINFPAWLQVRFPRRRFRLRSRGVDFRSRPCPCPVWIERRSFGSHYFRFTARWADPEGER